MKHLLIILSFLLLSSPVIGNSHKGETLYLWFVENGMVWKGFGDKETHPKYTGDVKNGKPNGLGVIFYPEWGMKYVGGWKDGEKDGFGTETLTNGVKHKGVWKDGEPWNTTLYTSYGTIYKRFVNGKYYFYDEDGNVTGKWVNGEYIEQKSPTKTNNKKEQGVLYHSRRNGDWEWYKSGNEKEDGKYEGELENGLPNGQGKIEYGEGLTGLKYVGEWKDGETWNGTTYFSDGEILDTIVNGKSIKQ